MHIMIIGLTNGHAPVTPVGNAPFRSSRTVTPGLVNFVPRLAERSRKNEFLLQDATRLCDCNHRPTFCCR